MDAKINCAKLIETPYAYRTYERQATALELTAAGGAIDLAGAVDITPIVDAVNTILSIPLLPAIPQVTALQAALTGVTTAAAQALLDAVTAILDAVTLIGATTYFTLIPNEEGTCLSGRKLILEGTLTQKVVYTGLVPSQSVHSVHNETPFTAYIIPYARFEGLEYQENITVIADPEGDPCDTIEINGWAYDPANPPVVDLCEEFCVNAFVEDIFACAADCRTIFKNVTLFLLAKPGVICG